MHFIYSLYGQNFKETLFEDLEYVPVTTHIPGIGDTPLIHVEFDEDGYEEIRLRAVGDLRAIGLGGVSGDGRAQQFAGLGFYLYIVVQEP